jgi:hypothetical protein
MEGDLGLAAGIPAGLTPREGRRFGLTVGGAFALLGAVLYWRGRTTTSTAFLVVGAVLIMAGIVIPGRLAPVHRAWMGFAHLLSKVTTPVFMGVVYFLVISPMGLIMRLFGRNPLVHRPAGDGYWLRREPHHDPTDTMRHQF